MSVPTYKSVRGLDSLRNEKELQRSIDDAGSFREPESSSSLPSTSNPLPELHSPPSPSACPPCATKLSSAYAPGAWPPPSPLPRAFATFQDPEAILSPLHFAAFGFSSFLLGALLAALLVRRSAWHRESQLRAELAALRAQLAASKSAGKRNRGKRGKNTAAPAAPSPAAGPVGEGAEPSTPSASAIEGGATALASCGPAASVSSALTAPSAADQQRAEIQEAIDELKSSIANLKEDLDMGRITRLEFTNAKTMIHATLAQQQQTLTSLRSTDLSQDLLGVAQSSHQLQLEKVLRKEEKDAEGRYRERLRTLALQMFAAMVLGLALCAVQLLSAGLSWQRVIGPGSDCDTFGVLSGPCARSFATAMTATFFAIPAASYGLTWYLLATKMTQDGGKKLAASGAMVTLPVLYAAGWAGGFLIAVVDGDQTLWRGLFATWAAIHGLCAVFPDAALDLLGFGPGFDRTYVPSASRRPFTLSARYLAFQMTVNGALLLAMAYLPLRSLPGRGSSAASMHAHSTATAAVFGMGTAVPAGLVSAGASLGLVARGLELPRLIWKRLYLLGLM